MKRVLYTSLVLVLAASAGCANLHAAFMVRRFESKVKNEAAPDFELTALDGGKVQLSDYRGKPVLLAFWAFG